MVDKIAIQQVLGCLMKKPSILSETDKYSFTPSDFSSTFEASLLQDAKAITAIANNTVFFIVLIVLVLLYFFLLCLGR